MEGVIFQALIQQSESLPRNEVLLESFLIPFDFLRFGDGGGICCDSDVLASNDVEVVGSSV